MGYTAPRSPVKRSAAASTSPRSQGAASGSHPMAGLGEWLEANREAVEKVERVLLPQMAHPNSFGDHTNMALCEDVFSIVRQSISGDGQASDSSSVLLLGEAMSGKTHAVEWCIQRLQEVQPKLIVLRARGQFYSTDVECVRHLATQVGGAIGSAPRANASFELGMAWLKEVLTESFKKASAAVIVLDRFEHFCSRSRQTLLYNLFDIAQDVGVCFSIVGMSERMDVTANLEKRIKSRFSMRHLHSFMPTTMDDLIQILLSKFKLQNGGLPEGVRKSFPKEFEKHLELALRAKEAAWQPHVELGRPPTWFLWQCLPLHQFLASAAGGPNTPQQKRRRLGVGPMTTEGARKALMLESLAEVDWVVLIGLYRLQDRQIQPTLTRLLHEVSVLHQQGGLVVSYSQDLYCAAFDRLVQMRLVRLMEGEMARRYRPCQSTVERMDDLVRDLERRTPLEAWNPLRDLPQLVQQWSTRGRR